MVNLLVWFFLLLLWLELIFLFINRLFCKCFNVKCFSLWVKLKVNLEDCVYVEFNIIIGLFDCYWINLVIFLIVLDLGKLLK